MLANEKEPRYRGDIVNCTRHGKGTYKYPLGGRDMISYVGTWNYGAKDGPGAKFTIIGFAEYVGDFKDGEMTGKGIKIWEDGRRYEGEWKDGEMSGRGYWINNRTNEIYDGFFKDNKRHGFGTLQNGNESYKGYFKAHKYHGDGTLLRSNQFNLIGKFEENLAVGNAKIDWLNSATLDACFESGQPQGNGIYVTKDGSYDFEGDFELSLPKSSEVAVSLWLDIDRTDVYAENAARDAALSSTNKKKDKKPSSSAAAGGKKGKNDKPTLEPLFSMQPGEAIGKISVRMSQSSRSDAIQEAITALRSAYALAKEAKPKLAAYDPAEEEKLRNAPPAICGVPAERVRRLLVRIRPITTTPIEDNNATNNSQSDGLIRHYGEPIDFWLKDHSLASCSSDKTRFSPHSLVILPSDSDSVSSWQDIYAAMPLFTIPAPQVAFKTVPDHNPMDIPATTHTATPSPLDLNSYLLAGSQMAYVSFDARRIDSNDQHILFLVDFSLDSNKCLTHQAATRPQTVKSMKSKARSAGGYMEIPFMTMKKEENSLLSELQLVLIVPDSYLSLFVIENNNHNSSMSKIEDAKDDQDAAVPAAPIAVEEVEVDVAKVLQQLVSWKGCSWELRHVTGTHSETTKVAAEGAITDESNPSPASPSQPISAEKWSVVCGWTAEETFLPDFWHSLAVEITSVDLSTQEIRSEDESSEVEKTIDDFKEQQNDILDEEGKVLKEVEFVNNKRQYSVDLVVNGVSRTKKTSRLGLGSIQRTNSTGNTAETASANAMDEELQSILSDWMNFHHTNTQATSKHDDNNSKTVEEENSSNKEELEKAAEVAASNGQIVLKVGSGAFHGRVRCLAVCARKHRVDSIKTTSCYINWRTARSPSQNPSDLPSTESADKSPASVTPPGYQLVNEAEVTCFCGSLEIGWDRVRIPVTFPASTSAVQEKQLYVMEVADAVNQDCVVAANTVCEPGDVAALVRMVRPVPSCYGPVFTIEAVE